MPILDPSFPYYFIVYELLYIEAISHNIKMRCALFHRPKIIVKPRNETLLY